MPRFGTLDTQFLDDSGDPLVSGKIYFYEPGTTTLKNTYKEAALTTANSNPVELTAAGRLDHDVYFSGSIDTKLVTSAGVQVKSFSSLGDSDGAFFETYSSALSYSSGDIVEYNGDYYKSLSNSNEGNTPSTSAAKWEKFKLVGYWNTNVTYAADDIVQGSDGYLYNAVISNSGNDPISDDGTNWESAAKTPFKIGDIISTVKTANYTAPTWLPCDGSSYNTTTYADLYALLGDVQDDLYYEVSTEPTGTPNDCAWSPSNTFFATAHGTTPYTSIYERTSDTFAKVANPATLPTGNANGCSFSPDGTLYAVAHANTPFVSIYSISGSTFTKESNPASLPASTGNACAFSPNGNYLAVAHNTSPYITIYSITAGPTFTKVSDPASLPAGNASSLCWSSDSAYLIVGHATSPYVTVYQDVSGTFVKQSDPADLPPTTVDHVAINSDDGLVALCFNADPNAHIYSFSAGALTFLPNAISIPLEGFASAGRSSVFSKDGKYWLFLTTSIPRFQYYSVNNQSLTPINLRTNMQKDISPNAAAFGENDDYLAITYATSPKINFFKGQPLLPNDTDNNGKTRSFIKTGL